MLKQDDVFTYPQRELRALGRFNSNGSKKKRDRVIRDIVVSHLPSHNPEQSSKKGIPRTRVPRRKFFHLTPSHAHAQVSFFFSPLSKPGV